MCLFSYRTVHSSQDCDGQSVNRKKNCVNTWTFYSRQKEKPQIKTINTISKKDNNIYQAKKVCICRKSQCLLSHFGDVNVLLIFIQVSAMNPITTVLSETIFLFSFFASVNMLNRTSDSAAALWKTDPKKLLRLLVKRGSSRIQVCIFVFLQFQQILACGMHEICYECLILHTNNINLIVELL